MANSSWAVQPTPPGQPPLPPADPQRPAAGYAQSNQWSQHEQQQWQAYAGAGGQQWAQQYAQPPPPPSTAAAGQPSPPGQPAAAGSDPSGYSAAHAAYYAAYGQAYPGYGQQWQQQQPQQQHYGSYGAYPAGTQASYDQYYWQQQQQQYGGSQAQAWQQHAGQAYARPQGAGGWPSGAQPPAASPAPPPQPPPPSAAASPSAAAAAVTAQHAQHAQQAQQQRYASDSYSAVPPPASLANPPLPAGGRRGFSIRPQLPKPKPPEPANPLVAAFQQAAAAAGPAYTRVQVGAAAQQAAAAALTPQQWPPALKAYVERAFKASDLRQRPKLQDVLKKVIADAQASGELWTRDWGAMPLPDLTQTAGDAAALLAEVAAVSGPAAAAGGQAFPGWGGAATAASLQQQQRQQKQQQAAAALQRLQQQRQAGRGAQRQRLDVGGGRRQRKRAYRDDSESSRSDSDGDGWSRSERQRRTKRAGRFQDSRGRSGGAGWHMEERRRQLAAMMEEGESDEEPNWDAVAIKGTCQELEKSYFRLTSAPDPTTVRPEPVLRAALRRLVGLLRDGAVNYFYALDQLKGMRQDCTVQHIRNDLAVQVYEAHARAALEYGDVAEYNQCQQQLRVLYNEGAPGCRCEMLAYRILYQSVHAKHGEMLQLLNTLKKITPEERADPRVAHALAVRSALAAADYPGFFRLYASAPAPGLGRALMDLAVPALRYDALKVLTKAFLPTLPVPFLAALLGFVAPPRRAASGAPAAAKLTAPGSGRGAAGESDSVGGEASERSGDGGEVSAAGGGAPPAAAAAAAPGAAAGSSGSAGEPLPGCIEAHFEGEHAAQVDLAEGCRDCIDFLLECGGVLQGAPEPPAAAALDCKASAGQLRMPEPKERVAHDDANLSLDDFLKSAMQ